MTSNEAEIMRLFSRRFRSWHDDGGITQPYWHYQSELEVNVRTWLAANSQQDIETFARGCLINLENNNCGLASKHLSAFLENIGYDAAKSVYKRIKEIQNNNRTLIIEKDLDELYQYALLAATNPSTFFDNFQSENPSLRNYAIAKIKGIINDGIFAKHNTRITGYGILRRLGPRQRKKALEWQGYKNTLTQYCLAWECFNQVCTGITGRVSPTDTNWENITKLYNRFKKQLPKEQANQNIDFQLIKKWIDDICIPAARNYKFPQINSLDIRNKETENPVITIIDPSPSPGENLVQTEINTLVQYLRKYFPYSDVLDTLEIQQKKVSLLRYGLKIRQVEIAQEMSWLDKNNKPINWTVSRCENRIIVRLVKETSIWIQQKIENKSYPYFQVDNIDNFNLNWLKKMGIKAIVENLLIQHYSLSINQLFKTVILSVNFSSQKLDEMFSHKRNNENTLLFMQRISQLENHKELTTSILNIHKSIVEQIQAHFNVTLLVGGTAAEKIMVIVLDWLKTNSIQSNI